MPSTPSKSDRPVQYVLTRPAQRSPKWHRVPSADDEPRDAVAAPAAEETGFFCLSTVAAYDVILDFESSAVVIDGIRRFIEPREVEVLAALLFAEGAAVAVAEIYRMCRFSAPNAVKDVVSRFVRRLRLVVAPLGTITPVPEGYRFLHHSRPGREGSR